MLCSIHAKKSVWATVGPDGASQRTAETKTKTKKKNKHVNHPKAFA